MAPQVLLHPVLEILMVRLVLLLQVQVILMALPKPLLLELVIPMAPQVLLPPVPVILMAPLVPQQCHLLTPTMDLVLQWHQQVALMDLHQEATWTLMDQLLQALLLSVLMVVLQVLQFQAMVELRIRTVK